jgi:D-alanyl-D-alanine carboxypeptidase
VQQIQDISGNKALEELLQDIYPPDGPGAAVIVIKNGEVLLRRGYGLANLELDVPIEPHMVFRIGSVTKQFTGMAILMLLKQGKLSLDDEITRFLPDYPTQGHKITIEHLLTHTSGIKSYTNMPEWFPLWRKDMSLEELISVFKDQPMEFAPGEKWWYNNSGYVLLGAMIEKASGIPYEQFLQEHIFEPLGMKHTYYDDPARVIPGRVSGYQKSASGWENAPYLSMTQPHAAGSLASSVDDLALWDAALHSEKLVDQSTLELAFTPYCLSDGSSCKYGFGWSVYEYAGRRIVEHGGGINGFICGTVRIPEEKVYVAVLTNSTNLEPSPDLLAFKLAALAIGHPYEEPEPIALDPDTLDAYPGVYDWDGLMAFHITQEGDQLFFMPAGAMKRPLIPITPEDFRIKDSQSAVRFIRNDDGQFDTLVVDLGSGPSLVSRKTEEVLPENRQAVAIDPQILDHYTGKYEIGPGMYALISRDGDRLMAQLTGQEPLEIFPASTTRFFLRQVAAEIEFSVDENGKVTGLVIEQGPQKLPGRKVG